MEVPKLDDPVKVALIGAGNRASTIYQPLLPSLKDWVEVVACVDPVKAALRPGGSSPRRAGLLRCARVGQGRESPRQHWS